MLNKVINNSIIRSALRRPAAGKISSVQILRKMSSNPLDAVPRVDMDDSGIFKYILCKVHEKDKDIESSIFIVRGYAKCLYHSDIYEVVQDKLYPLEVEPIGGGRISVCPDSKSMKIYGYSQGYGKADHEITAKVIKEKYPDYKISISDEGY